jgi:hypothetical protein
MAIMEKTVTASDVLQESYIADYKTQVDALSYQLLDLNMGLHILEKIERYPFELFGEPSPARLSPFWRTITSALLEQCITIIWRVAVDDDEVAGTLCSLRRAVLDHLRADIQPEAEYWLRRTLRAVNFEPRMQEAEANIRDIRRQYFARRNPAQGNPKIQPVREISAPLDDLNSIRTPLTELFDVLCFETRYDLWAWDYQEHNRKTGNTDLDRILDSIAQDHALLNAPEEDREFFDAYTRNDFTDNELAIFNRYRTKFGMSEIE